MSSRTPPRVQAAISATKTALREANSFYALEIDNFPVMAGIRAGIKTTADFFLRIDEYTRGVLTPEEFLSALSNLRSLAQDRRIILQDASRRGKAMRVSLPEPAELKLRYTVNDFRTGRSFHDYIRDVTLWVEGELAENESLDLSGEVRDDVFFSVLFVGIKDEFLSYFEDSLSRSDRRSLEEIEKAWWRLLKDRNLLARVATSS
ncbi:hypothetical protein SODALDRAFT_327009 [Sodiomyces alkalinus F11]|uniref:Uncharacterized protein n=1 Tax=Sodiomyces alkalinus (strain CBS 110278 / VKM F-3762 / F11) TaxID=1314773 RepID=A0A3N2Q7Y1_SODAK|nr:hypothetical protein SODALDRAFT_327009 [Sodiomyces alkalinus F11]ROT42852.1 hypothetical protein SODALDRAFT_327009 [Sodiomyces alkalinus F11]